MEATEKIKLLLIDDQKLFVESLQTVLENRAPDLVVIGVGYDGMNAVELVDTLNPDVILMDVRMPKLDGVESTRMIREKHPDAKILMLTTFDDDYYVIEALRLGAVGYLLKDMPPAELITAIRAVYEGGVLISPKVAAKIIEKITVTEIKNEEMAHQFDNKTISGNALSLVNELSDREKEILELMAEGLDNKAIAKKLYIAEQTVKNYVSLIYSKIGVRDRVQASRIMIQADREKEV